jgi:predicted P-loop ATPase
MHEKVHRQVEDPAAHSCEADSWQTENGDPRDAGQNPDLEQAHQFLELLDPNAEGFTFQAFDDSELKRGHLAKVTHGSLASDGRCLTAWNQAGAGIFITVNETDRMGRKAENITRVRAVFADLDGAPLQPVLICDIEPHIIVESSPRRFHAYWIVDGLALDQFGPVQKAIAARFNGDKAVHDLPRVMRLPGFWHQKGAPFMTRVHGISDRTPYTAGQILAEFPPAKAAANGASNRHDSEAEKHAELIRQLLSAETFHDALRSLSWRYLASGMAGVQVVETLRGFMLTIPEAVRDDRWQARFKEIARTVSTAQEKQRLEQEGEQLPARQACRKLRAAQTDEDPSLEIIAEEEQFSKTWGKVDDEDDDPGESRWKPRLIRSDRGPKDCIANGRLILEMDRRFRNQLRFDEMFSAPFVQLAPWAGKIGVWREWTEVDDLAFADWCQVRGVPLRPTTARDAVTLVASKRKHHAVRDYLKALTWDGTERLPTWLKDYLGAHTAPDAYLAAVGPAFMISAVARISIPGCKADHALILEGRQGIYKSTACRELFGPQWFADEISDLGSKDSAQDLRGKWCVEMSELSAMRRSQVERVKAFISRRVDHYRPSYGRRSQDFERQCVFIGTTNSNQYLEDETGGRRFWPVPCRRIDLAAIRHDRDQLWAEAVHRFGNREIWWLKPEIEKLAVVEQEDRRIIDAWEEPIRDWLMRHAGSEPTVSQILREALLKQPENWTRADAIRVGQCMRAIGGKKVRGKTKGKREHRYVPEGSPAPW